MFKRSCKPKELQQKSLFNKTGPMFYTSEQEIKEASELSGQLQEKFLTSFKYLSKLSWNTIMQGDLMYTNDKKMQKIDGKSFITFQPNTILYAVLAESDLGKQIAKSKMGIVFHTTYTGGTIQDLGASFGANISKLGSSSDVWIDDASYKDVSGKGSMTAKETLASLANSLNRKAHSTASGSDSTEPMYESSASEFPSYRSLGGTPSKA